MEAKNQIFRKTHYEVVKVVDGDGIIVRNILTKVEEDIRLYGIDAPELTPCRKLKQDESETKIAGQLLMKMAYESYDFMRSIVKPGDPVNIIQERNNLADKYGRTLAYVELQDGSILNEMMVIAGYAKAYNKIFCSDLPRYQQLSLDAKTQKKGLYLYVDQF
ncbi:thermonuclease family protein [Kaistella palustris]|uniref:thermonuclease family protein n=1 Tax=Kaistella palustris TaxID=493376 RepID=UPI0004836AF4|nr:thermonuclease family protein [Kaistella palustris]